MIQFIGKNCLRFTDIGILILFYVRWDFINILVHIRNTDIPMIYYANYVKQDDLMMALSDEDICKLYQKDIEAVAGKFTYKDVKISRARYATPVFDIGFLKKMACLRVRMKSMIFAGMVDIYPGD